MFLFHFWNCNCLAICFVLFLSLWIFFLFSFFLNLIANMYCSLVLLIMSPSGWLHRTSHPRFDLGHHRVSELCNWKAESPWNVVKGGRNVYAWRNGQCWVGNSIPERGCRAQFPPPPRLVVVGRSRMYIVFFWKSMKIGGKMLEMGEKSSWD